MPSLPVCFALLSELFFLLSYGLTLFSTIPPFWNRTVTFLFRGTDARVMLLLPELFPLGCFRFSFSTRWLSRCLAAAPLAQLFAAAAAGETVAVLLASCVLLLSVAGACAGTVIVLCAVAVAELSVAAADGETLTVLLSGYLFLFSVAGACSCMFFLSS